MLIIGSILAIIGFALIWFSPFTGLIAMAIGLGMVWSSEEQKIKQKNDKKQYDEENEKEYEKLKFEEPISAKLFELATLIHGSIKPHEAWLLSNLNSLEEMYALDPEQAIFEIHKVAEGKFKGLFVTGKKYKEICDFLKRDTSEEIFEDIEVSVEKMNRENEKIQKEETKIPTLNEILEESELEDWLKINIKSQLDEGIERNELIKNITEKAKKELNKDISVARIRDEWIVNGTLRFKI
ncbi:MAG: hypothetical protein VYE27_03930 [Pseudomonadota bacterium]|nr:hypothetical protein [Pseudomonadota bacterium]